MKLSLCAVLLSALFVGTAAGAQSFDPAADSYDDDGGYRRPPRQNSGDLCFHDYNSYMQVRNRLPWPLGSGRVYAIHRGWDFTGVFKIVPAGSQILIEAHASSAIGGYNVSAYIVRACLYGNQMQVALDNGEDQRISINGGSLIIKGRNFQMTDAGTYQDTYNRMHGGRQPE